MVNENLTPKTEMVYELKEKYEVPSFEEFMTNYKSDEGVDKSYELEYQDRVLHGPQYGPGNNMSNEDRKNVAKGTTGIVGGLGIAALTIVCPPVGIGTAATVGAIGATSKVASNFVPKDSDAHELLEFIGDSYIIASSVNKGANKVLDK